MARNRYIHRSSATDSAGEAAISQPALKFRMVLRRRCKIVSVGSARIHESASRHCVQFESALESACWWTAELSDSSGFRVIREYRHEFPELPTR